MMNKLTARMILVMVCFALLMAAAPTAAQDGARARFVHAAPGLGAIDIFVNGQLVEAHLAYGDATSYVMVPTGVLDVAAHVAGASSPVLSQRAAVSGGETLTFLASSAIAGEMQLISENLSALSLGTSRLYIVYAIANGPTIDIISSDNNEVLAVDKDSGAVVGPYELNAGVYDLQVIPADVDASETLVEMRVPAAAGTSQLAIIYGSANNPQVLMTAASTASGSDSGLVRFVHAVQGATPFALRLNDSLIVPSLAYAMPTNHIALPSGSHRVSLGIGDAEITSMTLGVAANAAQTVVIMGTPAQLSLTSYSDDLSGIDDSSALVSLINAIPDSVVDRLALSSGATAADDIAYGQGSGAAKIVSGEQTLMMNLSIGDESGTVDLPASQFHSGSYYNLIALPGSAFSGPRLLIAETSVLRGMDIEGPMMAVETAMETAPMEMEEASPQVAVRAADVEAPTAFVNLNRGVNLHLRQYPHVDSLSLGLAPSGATLIVLGRRGRTVYYGEELDDEPVDLSDFEDDPAVGLERWEDLEPADTWLYVTYMTPDGGSIIAWVNALHLEVSDEDGQPQRLANLDMVRQNQAGTSRGTSIGPPQPIERIGAYVFNLNAGVKLNIRRANSSSSENLGQVGNGDIVRLVGLDIEDEWAFVEYSSMDGVTVRGWVSVTYVQFTLDGNAISLEDLREIDPEAIAAASSSLRGGVVLAGEAEAPPAPTRDPFHGAVAATVNVDPEANLHLRVLPDANRESLALIPSGTRMLVDGITESEDWFKVRHDDLTGWVSADFILLSINNFFLPLDDVFDRLKLYDEMGNVLP